MILSHYIPYINKTRCGACGEHYDFTWLILDMAWAVAHQGVTRIAPSEDLVEVKAWLKDQPCWKEDEQ